MQPQTTNFDWRSRLQKLVPPIPRKTSKKGEESLSSLPILTGFIRKEKTTEILLHGENFIERAAIIEHEGGLPRAWSEAFAELCVMQDNICPHIREQAVTDAGLFVDGKWGKQAVALGWKPEWVFGHTPRYPAMSGLVWCIGGGLVIAATLHTVKIRMPSGCIITCRLTRDVRGKGCFWETDNRRNNTDN